MENGFTKWSNFYRNENSKTLQFPSETLIRLLKGRYIPQMDESFQGKKILDIGFGHGNNLCFFGGLGFQLFGIEVKADICEKAAGSLKKIGYSSELRTGSNREIPFPDNYFDYLVSWDVLHYEGNEKQIHEALGEYYRVLKPKGRLLLSTIAPEHSILRNADHFDTNNYRIQRDDDFRKGQTFFCFESKNDLRNTFQKWFSEVFVGRTNNDLFTEIVDCFIATAEK